MPLLPPRPKPKKSKKSAAAESAGEGSTAEAAGEGAALAHGAMERGWLGSATGRGGVQPAADVTCCRHSKSAQRGLNTALALLHHPAEGGAAGGEGKEGGEAAGPPKPPKPEVPKVRKDPTPLEAS